MNKSKFRVTGILLLFGFFFNIGSSYAYTVAGANGSITPDSANWAFDGTFISGFRGALENPANFGPGGIVEESITTVGLDAINAATLATADMFVSTWISDSDGAAFGGAVVDFFLNGGDLYLLQDDSSHDYIGELLGITTSVSTGSVSNGGVPLFNGPFGTATNVTQHYSVGQLSGADIAARNGNIGGTNVEGQITSAFWAAGEYAAGAGSLFIVADIDMIATTTPATYGSCLSPVCGADYDTLNDNAIYALNTFSFLRENGGTSVPEATSMYLFAFGLLGLLGAVRRKA